MSTRWSVPDKWMPGDQIRDFTGAVWTRGSDGLWRTPRRERTRDDRVTTLILGEPNGGPWRLHHLADRP